MASIIIPYFTNGLASSGNFSGLLRAQSEIESVPWIQHAGVAQGTVYSGSSNKTYLSISARVNDGRIGDEARATEIATLAMKADPEVEKIDAINIVMVYGFDIGIASGWQMQRFSHSPDQWKAMSLQHDKAH